MRHESLWAEKEGKIVVVTVAVADDFLFDLLSGVLFGFLLFKSVAKRRKCSTLRLGSLIFPPPRPYKLSLIPPARQGHLYYCIRWSALAPRALLIHQGLL